MRPYLQCGRLLAVNKEGAILLCVLPMQHPGDGCWNPAFKNNCQLELYPGVSILAASSVLAQAYEKLSE